MNYIDDDTKRVLKDYINRIENLEAKKAEISQDIKDVFNDAKAKGFVPEIMKRVIKMRKMNSDDLMEQEELVQIYRDAVGS